MVQVQIPHHDTHRLHDLLQFVHIAAERVNDPGFLACTPLELANQWDHLIQLANQFR
jgi:hypothetical protein